MILKIRKALANSTIFAASFLGILFLITISLNNGSTDTLPIVGKYLSTLTAGSLGEAHYGGNVAAEVALRLPRTLILALFSLAAGSSAGIFIGLLFSYGGDRRGIVQTIVNTVPVSLPDIMIIILIQLAMIRLHSSNLPHLPVSGYGSPDKLVLPVLCLSIIPAFYLARITYAFAVNAYSENFVLTAKAKGCSAQRIHWQHVWKRIRPQATEAVYGVIPLLVSNMLIIEKMFIYPGLSYNLFKALKTGDIYLFMGLTIGLSLVYFSLLLIVWFFRKLDFSFRRANIR